MSSYSAAVLQSNEPIEAASGGQVIDCGSGFDMCRDYTHLYRRKCARTCMYRCAETTHICSGVRVPVRVPVHACIDVQRLHTSVQAYLCPYMHV